MVEEEISNEELNGKKDIVANDSDKSLDEEKSNRETSKINEKNTKSKPAITKPEEKKKKEKAKVEIEREYIVPLRRGFLNVPHYRRAKKAVRVLKEFMVRHMNIRDGDRRKVKVNIHLNNEIWFRGIRNPLNKIKVIAKKIDGIVYVELAEIPNVIKFKIAREEKAKIKREKGNVKVTEKKKNTADNKVKKEEKEKEKAGAVISEKIAKDKKLSSKHTTEGKHEAKSTPVRKVLK